VRAAGEEHFHATIHGHGGTVHAESADVGIDQEGEGEVNHSKTAELAAFSIILGAFGGFSDHGLGPIRSSKEHCAECGEKIPPGKAGRKCTKCRKEKAK
jgi:hypothetical protein